MKSNILKLSSFLFAAVAFTGCLKDKGYEDGRYQSLSQTGNQKIVSIGLTTTLPPTDPEYNVALKAISNSMSPIVLDLVPVTLAGGVVAEQDVHVVIDTSSAILNAYNTSPTGSYVYDLPDPTKYSIVSKTLTIPKGQSTAYLQIRLTPNDFINGAADDAFGFGVKIVSVDGGYAVAGQGKDKGVAAFIINNQYAGHYVANGYFYHPASPRAIVNLGIDATTSSANSIKVNLGDLANLVNLTVDGTNHVTVTDAGPAPGIAPTQAFTSLPGGYTPFAGSNPSIYNNTYNPTTHTFYLRFGYQGASGYRVVEEVLQLQ